MNPEVYERHLHLDRHHFWRIAKRSLILQMLEAYLPSSRDLRILDVGSATSQILLDLQEFGDLTAVEPSKEAIEMTQKLLGIAMVQGFLPRDLPDGRFDLITLFDVLEHVDDDKGAVKELACRLKDEGILICTVPAYKWLWSSHDVVLHHHRRYTNRQLRSLLCSSGFRICRITYYTSLLFPFLCAQRFIWNFNEWKGKNDHTYKVNVPISPVNSILGYVMVLERFIMRYINLPFGSALIVVARKV